MIVRAGRDALAALIIILAPAIALAGDGTFGIPSSGILMPPPPKQIAPRQTASLTPPERADIEKQRNIQRVQQTYSPAPADGAGRSRVIPPSEAPIHSPIVVPPKKKQFKAPVATVDPSYIERVAAGVRDEPPPAITASVAQVSQVSAPVMAQGAAPEAKRGLFGMLRSRSAAAAAYEEYAARPVPVQTAYVPQPATVQPRAASRFSFGGAKPSARASDGTPCGQLRGIFTSPVECR